MSRMVVAHCRRGTQVGSFPSRRWAHGNHNPNKLLFFFLFFFFFTTGSHVAQASLKLPVWLRLALAAQSSCRHLPSAGLYGCTATIFKQQFL